MQALDSKRQRSGEELPTLIQQKALVKKKCTFGNKNVQITE